MKDNNKGFSIIELLVVMAIIAIVSVIAGVSISASNTAKTERTAASINALISKCRADCLGRTGSVYLTISLDSNGDIVCLQSDGTTVSTETFSGTATSVSYTTKLGSADPVEVSLSGHPLTLSFNRSTGGLNPQSGGSYCTSIIFTGGKSFTIVLVPSTGTHSLT